MCPQSSVSLGNRKRAYWGDGTRQSATTFKSIACGQTLSGTYPGGNTSFVFQTKYRGTVNFDVCASGAKSTILVKDIAGKTLADSTRGSNPCQLKTPALAVDRYIVFVKSPTDPLAKIVTAFSCPGKHLKSVSVPKGCQDYNGCDTDGAGTSPCFVPAGTSTPLKCIDGKAADVIKGKAPYICGKCPSGYQA